MEPGVTIDWVRLPYGDFAARLVSSRFAITPSARMVVSSLVQYNAGANSFTSSIRLRWEDTGGRELFVVYGDRRNTRERRSKTARLSSKRPGWSGFELRYRTPAPNSGTELRHQTPAPNSGTEADALKV
jgi:hypothetical protein